MVSTFSYGCNDKLLLDAQVEDFRLGKWTKNFSISSIAKSLRKWYLQDSVSSFTQNFMVCVPCFKEHLHLLEKCQRANLNSGELTFHETGKKFEL